jgi:hypothetical protein
MSEPNGRTHVYHAEAQLHQINLDLPLNHKGNHTTTKLPEDGGYYSEQAQSYSAEGVITYRNAYTRVAGNPDPKPGHGWATLTTTVVEGLNIMEVLTADRVVGQISTEHPLEGYVPTVSFLGTRFENLRIAGHPVSLDLDIDMLGSRPAGDGSYASEAGVVARTRNQYRRILDRIDLPADLAEKFNQLSSALGGREAVECSLVSHAAGGYPGLSFGHVIRIPNFGTVELAKVEVTHGDISEEGTPKTTTVKLTMLDLKFGCMISGGGGIGIGSTNGATRP